MSSFTRRRFLALSGTAALAATQAGRLSAAEANPFARSGAPRLHLALAAYSFRENFPMMRGKPNAKLVQGGKMSLFDFVDFCGRHQVGAELTSYFFDEESDDYVLRLRRHCFLAGVPISGTAIGNNFSLPTGAELDQQVATTKQWIDRAALLGAPHIRVFAGVEKGLSRADADQQVIRCLKEVGAHAARKGVFLGLENHDSIGTAATLIPMVKAVNNPWVGINLDSGNFRTADPYRDFAECLPYSLNVQIKAEIGYGDKKGSADLKRLVKLIRDSGYQGWVALEYEAKEPSATAVPRLLSELQSLIG